MYVWLFSIERAGLQSRLDFSAARRLRLSCFARQVNISSWPIAVVWPPVRIATLLPTMWVRNCDACSGVWCGAAMEQMPAIFERLTRDIPRARKALCLAQAVYNFSNQVEPVPRCLPAQCLIAWHSWMGFSFVLRYMLTCPSHFRHLPFRKL